MKVTEQSSTPETFDNPRVARQAALIAAQSAPLTISTIAADLHALGVEKGMTLLVHSSLSKIGWVAGGAVAVILALEETLTPEGTLVMPTHSADLTEPSHWRNPPIPESWWEPFRQNASPFSPSLTPTHGMGAIPEAFRKQDGVLRSNHPSVSFAAWGKHASFVAQDQPLSPLFGNESPLARVYDLEGWVLLLGVGHGNNTSLHLCEWRADLPRTYELAGAPIIVDSVRQWAAWQEMLWSDEDFVELGAAFAAETGLQREGKIGAANAILVPQRQLVDFGVEWLGKNRGRA